MTNLFWQTGSEIARIERETEDGSLSGDTLNSLIDYFLADEGNIKTALKNIFTKSFLESLRNTCEGGPAPKELLESHLKENLSIYSEDAINKLRFFGYGYLGISIESAAQRPESPPSTKESVKSIAKEDRRDNTKHVGNKICTWSASAYYAQNNEVEEELVIELRSRDISSGQIAHFCKVRIWIVAHFKDNEAIVVTEGGRQLAIRVGDYGLVCSRYYARFYIESDNPRPFDIEVRFQDKPKGWLSEWWNPLLEEIIVDGVAIDID